MVTGTAFLPAPAELRAMVARVADRAMLYRYYHWDWGEAIAMEGLWLAAGITRRETYRAYVERMVRGWVAHSPDPWYPDHVGPGSILLELWRATGDAGLLAYAERLGQHLSGLPKGRLGTVFHRPDLPDRERMAWVDSMQTDAPFLCRLAEATHDAIWLDRATAHLRGHVAALQDAGTGLFYHQYDEETGRRNGVLWARGNGWAMLGLVGCLESLPPSHPDYPVILQYFRRLAAAVIGTQDPHTSLWHTVITDAKTSHEGSASLMLSGGLMRAANAGLLEAPFGAAGARAWEQLWNAVDDDGTVRRVSARTPPRSDPGAYESRPMGDNHPWGQGAHLLASAAWLDAHGMYGAYRDTGGGSDGRS